MTITVEDLRNPNRKSGFSHVGKYDKGKTARGHGGGAPFVAESNIGGGKDTAKPSWRGPRRLTAEEAAQDYCDYINGSATPATPALKSAGHKRATREKYGTEAVREARQVLRELLAKERATQGPQGFIYLIGESVTNMNLGTPSGRKWELVSTRAVKIGYSDAPDARIAMLQTGNPRVLALLGTIGGTLDDERALHAKYIEDNVLQEWFRPTPELLSEFGVKIKAQSPSTLCVVKGEA